MRVVRINCERHECAMCDGMQITFWGVRGSTPVPGTDTLQYGGNTACVQIQMDQQQLVFDAGSGLVNLGRNMAADAVIHLFLSHLHWDHILGFPFFPPAFRPETKLHLYGPAGPTQPNNNPLAAVITPPWFPVPLTAMSANIDYTVLHSGEAMHLPQGALVKTQALVHPDRCLGYRIEAGGRSCCYITDHETGSKGDRELAAFIDATDVLIMDAQFTDAEYQGGPHAASKHGWGHSTWQAAVKLAQSAAVKRLVLFHHDPARTDQALSSIEQHAQKQFTACEAAREGMVIRL